MENLQRLKNQMRKGSVYRRQDLLGLTSDVDRDLKKLCEAGDVRKLSGGLYYRPVKNAFGQAPPNDKDVVRAFLKTDRFLLTSFNHYNQLGLGLTQLYNKYVVYNHKRSGEFSLGGKAFTFRVVPDFPAKLSKEFLLVDLLNNLKRVPEDTDVVLQNLKHRLNEFDHENLRRCLNRYGRPSTRALFKEAHA